MLIERADELFDLLWGGIGWQGFEIGEDGHPFICGVIISHPEFVYADKIGGVIEDKIKESLLHLIAVCLHDSGLRHIGYGGYGVICEGAASVGGLEGGVGAWAGVFEIVVDFI